MTLRFTPGNHRYTLDGRWVPSVTGITGGGLPKPALLQWHADVVADFVADNPSIVAELRETGDYAGISPQAFLAARQEVETLIGLEDYYAVEAKTVEARQAPDQPSSAG